MSIIKYAKYGKNQNSLLVGVTHNHKKSVDYISSLFSSFNFKESYFYLLELNIDNYFFIRKNKLVFSEFYPFLKNTALKTELIDMKLEREIKIYNISKGDFFFNYLQYNHDKFIYYKIRNTLVHENLNFEKFVNHSLVSNIIKIVHQMHIIKREEYMIDVIKQISQKRTSKNILVVVGISHFDNIKMNIT